MQSIGTIKWYGGTNARMGKANRFGFVEDVGGNDAFLHVNAWGGEETPKEGEVVAYALTQTDKGWTATGAALISTHTSTMSFATSLLARVIEFRDEPHRPDAIDICLREISRDALLAAEHGTVQALLRSPRLCKRLWSLLASGGHWATDLEVLIAKGAFNPFDAIPWHLLPNELFVREEALLASYLASLDQDQAVLQIDGSCDRLPTTLLIYLASIGVVTSSTDLGDRKQEMDAFIESVVVQDSVTAPDYLVAHVASDLGHYQQLGSSEVLAPAMCEARFRRLLFEKNPSFVQLYRSSSHLQSRIDCFILANVFGFIVADNDTHVMYDLFVNRLWESISEKQYDLLTPETRGLLLGLLPSCQTLGQHLSCEAFFWKEDKDGSRSDLHLCRSKLCKNPQVFPETNKPWSDFTLYDWFAHYGIKYSSDERPARRDFPIKLAGYFNRVVELLERLDCRACGELMLPDFKYARTGWWENTPSGREWKNHTAAYRNTLFQCGNSDCHMRGEKHYINHCRGFKCYQPIDSRDIDEQCDQGRYLCPNCGSCCPAHEQPQRVERVASANQGSRPVSTAFQRVI